MTPTARRGARCGNQMLDGVDHEDLTHRSRTRNKLAAAVSASDSDVSETIHATETKIEGLLNNERPPSQNGSSNGDRPRSRNRALAAVADSKDFAVPSPVPTAASPVQTSLVTSLELERDELKREVDRLRASSDNGDAHERLKAVRSRVAPRAFDPTSMAYTPSPRRPRVQGPHNTHKRRRRRRPRPVARRPRPARPRLKRCARSAARPWTQW